tara:strand:- start:786 stop:2615 length:1830 start_codon:yes stop_codon:yes gene_type:complete
MCGIAGYIGHKNINPKKINDTLDLMRRRGPDNQDCWSDKNNDINTYLLHSRLSILDLDKRSNQPYEFDNCILVFNGEIYNYIELRAELKRKGHSFSTNSDTEVLIKSYIEFGSECVNKFNGMWSFAIWDKRKKKLFISRDRFGEKPLYYYSNSDGIFFGSEIKFIFSLYEKKLPINYNHIYRYLINGYKSINKVNETFFHDIKEIESGTSMTIDLSLETKNERYWKPSFEQDLSLEYDDIVNRSREIMEHSVQLRLRSDVPLAFCMSGGVDSNSLISIAKNVYGYDVHGFTIVNEDKRYDEKEIVDRAVKEQGLKHTEIPVDTSHFLPKLRQLIRYHDAPVSTITYYAHWLLIQSISQHGYRISISGTGADELFSGYFDHHLSYFSEIHKNKKLYNKSLNNWKKHIEPTIRNPYLKNPKLMIDDPNFRDHIFFNADGFSSYLLDDWFEEFSESNYCDSLLRNRMANEMFKEIVPVILHEDDLNSMYFSIENRSPYLDYQLFEFCQTIPTKYLIQNGYAKMILRDSMNGIAPDEILQSHQKVGFNAPIHSFLDLNDEQVKEYLINDSPIFDHVDKTKITSILKKKNLPNSESKFLFNFVNLKIFLEEFSN